MMLRADSDTQIYFQIGYPLKFSVATTMHNAMFQYANVNAVCLTKEVKKGELGPFVQAVKTLGLGGFDITMPHKSDIIPYLDEVDEMSREFESVNHVNLRDGRLIGMTVDGVGMRMAIEAEGMDISGKRLLFLGAGGVAGPVAAALCEAGAEGIVILNRTADKAAHIAEILARHFSIDIEYGEMTPENLKKYCPGTDILVQCTCLGMAGKGVDFEDVSFLDALSPHAFVADCVVSERTKLLDYAQGRGLHVMNGLAMLIMQQKAMLKFHFDIDVSNDFYDFGEEGLLVGIAMRGAKSARDARAKK